MTIADMREKCKSQIAKVPRDILIIAILILASSASFGLGYLSGVEKGQGSEPVLKTPSIVSGEAGQVVASKGGTKYYFSSCSGAGRISDANKIWFVSAEAARAAGYTLGANCKEN